MKNIGLMIKDQRIKLGLSQTELADKLGVTKSFMSKLESGKKPISLKRLTELGSILEIDVFESIEQDNERYSKWQVVIDMFEAQDLEPEDVLLLEAFIKKVKGENFG
ncbi:helix-turn-helix transcriptional regulator [Bacillus sp. AG4(2022)]|uniref:helix-turn-helix domain-containing protein n=1 Tax=Bacillus sp. AG4(2022) TaxID=2962594 RepID=UPI002882CD87|nr:helix-turn-helix transcriptional regulator [Bacillus sp. AG4(2022)]MDT0160364.1 helix-turn-helix transcriptional regulator [Bacillus sp. AG4(2022)]